MSLQASCEMHTVAGSQHTQPLASIERANSDSWEADKDSLSLSLSGCERKHRAA